MILFMLFGLPVVLLFWIAFSFGRQMDVSKLEMESRERIAIAAHNVDLQKIILKNEADAKLNEAKLLADARLNQAKLESDARLNEAKLNAEAKLNEAKILAEAKLNEAKLLAAANAQAAEIIANAKILEANLLSKNEDRLATVMNNADQRDFDRFATELKAKETSRSNDIEVLKIAAKDKADNKKADIDATKIAADYDLGLRKMNEVPASKDDAQKAQLLYVPPVIRRKTV